MLRSESGLVPGKLTMQVSGMSDDTGFVNMSIDDAHKRHSFKMSSKNEAFAINLSRLAEIDEEHDDMGSSKKLEVYPNTNRHILAKTSTNVLSNIKPSPPQSTKNHMQKLKRSTPSQLTIPCLI